MHLHGALGLSNEMPFGGMWSLAPGYAVWDGPTESHLSSAARLILRDHQPAEDDLPSQWLPRRMAAARAKHAAALAEQAACCAADL